MHTKMYVYPLYKNDTLKVYKERS
uniref:Uncharacterized protein n=1 Tax=Arundo donax TaxID=35708 RepID=A0A0A8YVS8_ARUDO